MCTRTFCIQTTNLSPWTLKSVVYDMNNKVQVVKALGHKSIIPLLKAGHLSVLFILYFTGAVRWFCVSFFFSLPLRLLYNTLHANGVHSMTAECQASPK